MNNTIFEGAEINNSLYFPRMSTQTLTYKEVLDSLGSQIIDKFLWIGVIILITSLWHIFGGNERNDKISQNITGALNYLSLCSGLTSIIFWLIFKGWIKI